MEQLLQRFIELDIDRSGTVSGAKWYLPSGELGAVQVQEAEFAEALGLPDNEYVHHLFELLDRV